MNKAKRARGARGYLLLEALVAAGVVASVVGSMLVSVGDARDDAVRQERERTAQHLLYEAYEVQRSKGYAGLPATTGVVATEGTLSQGGGTYRRETSVTAVGTESFGGFGGRDVTLSYKEIEVAVQFPANPPASMPQDQIVRLKQRFRIYRI